MNRHNERYHPALVKNVGLSEGIVLALRQAPKQMKPTPQIFPRGQFLQRTASPAPVNPTVTQVYDATISRFEEQDFNFSQFSSPAVSPIEVHNNAPEYIVPETYVNSISSPALGAQNKRKSSHVLAESTTVVSQFETHQIQPSEYHAIFDSIKQHHLPPVCSQGSDTYQDMSNFSLSNAQSQPSATGPDNMQTGRGPSKLPLSANQPHPLDVNLKKPKQGLMSGEEQEGIYKELISHLSEETREQLMNIYRANEKRLIMARQGQGDAMSGTPGNSPGGPSSGLEAQYSQVSTLSTLTYPKYKTMRSDASDYTNSSTLSITPQAMGSIQGRALLPGIGTDRDSPVTGRTQLSWSQQKAIPLSLSQIEGSRNTKNPGNSTSGRIGAQGVNPSVQQTLQPLPQREPRQLQRKRARPQLYVQEGDRNIEREPDPSSNAKDKRLFQSPSNEEPKMIKCICGYWHDDGNTIRCNKCLTWQHKKCFYLRPEDGLHLKALNLCANCGVKHLEQMRHPWDERKAGGTKQPATHFDHDQGMAPAQQLETGPNRVGPSTMQAEDHTQTQQFPPGDPKRSSEVDPGLQTRYSGADEPWTSMEHRPRYINNSGVDSERFTIPIGQSGVSLGPWYGHGQDLQNDDFDTSNIGQAPSFMELDPNTIDQPGLATSASMSGPQRSPTDPTIEDMVQNHAIRGGRGKESKDSALSIRDLSPLDGATDIEAKQIMRGRLSNGMWRLSGWRAEMQLSQREDVVFTM